ncbi:hypothetical protein CFP56_039780 [Quercus suber]|uniref:Uncharacterized protein n=1 Tax=Quercus suber TaxID=58331 RepID=A0AAW0MC14_QUESU
MSSAFDALMSGARATAAKKRPQPQLNPSSPKKRKTLDSNPPQNPKTTKLPNENVNKILNLFGPERVEHLKSKMPELKNKSWNFDPRIGCLLGRGRARFFVWVLT